MSSLNGICDNSRLSAAINFYANVNNKTVIIPDAQEVHGHAEDRQGSFLLETTIGAAKALNVYEFVRSLEDGGVDIPVVRPECDYVEAHLEPKRAKMAERE